MRARPRATASSLAVGARWRLRAVVAPSARSGCASGRLTRRCSTSTTRRRRSSSIGAACRSTRRCRATARAASTSTPATCRRCSSRRRSPPRIAASGRIPASIRSRSRARCGRTSSEGSVVEGGSTITQQVAKLLLNRRSPKRARGVAREDPRGGARAAARAPLRQARDARALPEPRGLRQSDRRRRPGEPRLLRHRSVDADAGAGGVSRRPAAAAVRLQPVPQPRPGDRAAADRASTDAGRRRADAPTSAREARDERLRFSRTTAPFLAPHFVEMVLRRAGPNRAGADRDDARRRAAERRRRHHQQPPAGARAARRGERRGRRARQRARRVAGLGRIGRLRRRRARRRDQRPARRRGSQGRRSSRSPMRSRSSRASRRPACWPTCRRIFRPPKPGVLYSPRNYDGRYRGPLLARRALAGSENVPAVVARVRARRAGAAALSDARRPLDLRSHAVVLRPRPHARQRRSPARRARGRVLGVRARRRVARADLVGRAVDSASQAARSAIASARLAAHGATGSPTSSPTTSAREYIFGRGGNLEFPFPVAVKTGTSQAYHDNWTVGYTRDVTVGVWVGNFDRTPLKSSTGVTGAAPIFHAVMLAATRAAARRRIGSTRAPIVAAPDGVVEREICALSGMPANPWCPARQRERLPAGDDPPCSWHHQSDDGLLVVWPPVYRQWARENGLADRAGAIESSARRRVRSIDAAGATRLDVRSRSSARRPARPTSSIRRCAASSRSLPLRVVAATPGTIEWQVAGRVVGTSSSEAPLDVAADSGRPPHHRERRARARGGEFSCREVEPRITRTTYYRVHFPPTPSPASRPHVP